MDTQARLRVAEVRAEDVPTAIPDGVEALDHRALARRMGVSSRTARRMIERLRAAQHRPDALRVVLLPVRIGSGAMREALHVLWPRPTEDDLDAA